MTLLIGMAPLMYSTGGKDKNSKRTGKIMMIFANICATLMESGLMSTDKHRFLMGSLYALVELFKIECKSFLMTKNDKYTKNPESNVLNFKLVAPLTNSKNEMEASEVVHLRLLDDDEVEFFYKEFIYVVIYFIKSILLNT